MRKISFLFLFVATFQFTLAQNGTEPVLITDMLKIKTIGNVTLTKDGKKAAFTVNSIEQDEKNKKDYQLKTQIYSIETSANAPVQLTTSEEGASQPAWSPDGKQLAFTRKVGDKPQIFVLSMEGGEPWQLTKSKYGAASPKWSPDGKKILYSSGISLNDLLRDTLLNNSNSLPQWPSEKPGFIKNEYLQNTRSKTNPDGNLSEIRAYLDSNAVDKKAIVMNKLNFQSETGLSSDRNFNHYFLADVIQDAKPISLTGGFYSFGNATFTPDGKQIIVSTNTDSLENPDRVMESQVFLVDIESKNLKKILGERGKRFGNATISPSGKWLIFTHSNIDVVTIPTIALMPVNGSKKDMVNIPYDQNADDFTWSKDEKYVYFTAQANGGEVLNRIHIPTKKIETLSDFNSGITSFDLANNTLIFSKTEVANPSELYIADANLKNSRKVSRFNDWVKTKKLSFPEKKTFINDQGMQVEYWVMKPTDFQAGKKYPLLLEIHGGPSAMWGPGESSMWHEFQYFCSKGYGIVYSNPRGSGGYGLDFLRANINDWGNGPASDVLISLDKTVAEGWADTSKLMITGGSYAGYITAWIISHDKRFAAACSQRGVYDLLTFFGEGNAWRLVPLYFGGYLWEPNVKETLVKESPINYVQNITTPYIIFHGGNDRRTGFVQAEMMFRSLKVLNRPVEFVVHPGATHELTRSGDNRQRIDQLLRTYEFFERWIGKK
jgi:dipeptidyl aminopeptidase/acylaminoacyl peptidase